MSDQAMLGIVASLLGYAAGCWCGCIPGDTGETNCATASSDLVIPLRMHSFYTLRQSCYVGLAQLQNVLCDGYAFDITPVLLVLVNPSWRVSATAKPKMA